MPLIILSSSGGWPSALIHNYQTEILLTKPIGVLRSAIERVNSSFHSGLQLFFTTRVFKVCTNLSYICQKNTKKIIQDPKECLRVSAGWPLVHYFCLDLCLVYMFLLVQILRDESQE